VFTGRISDVGRIVSSVEAPDGRLVTVEAQSATGALRVGGTVAVAGQRLTVTQIDGDRFDVLVNADAASRTTLRAAMAGRMVNVEAPLRAGDPLDGHLVQGRIDGLARVISRRASDGLLHVWLRPNKRLIREIAPRDPVAIDGVSLDVAEVNKGAFSVVLIPDTLRRTTLSSLVPGDDVNLETDVLVRHRRAFGQAPKRELAWAGLLSGREAVEKAVATVAAGGMVVVWDPVRESEGDVILAADRCSPSDVNFLMTHARGLICAPMAKSWLDRLGFGRLPSNGGLHGTAFTMPVDAAVNTTTGIPASDRARTLRLLANPAATADSFVWPGHIFPLVEDPDGVLGRAGHTEAAVALARLAGRAPVAVCCEIAAPDGEMAGLADLELFAAHHGLPMLSIDDLTAYIRTADGARALPEACLSTSGYAGADTRTRAAIG
jgi:3,4-dihydroxy 2-butanone 4-phosphate synthase/3,4-dihydroxy 2-butanone 4-phosphate synthase/GTP cyclohydrolase II